MSVSSFIVARLLIVGESLVEFVRPQRGLGLAEPGVFVGPFPSGAPAICADAAALSGADVALVATIGADAFGKLLSERLASDRVDVTGVRVLDEAVTGTAFVAYGSDGEREFIFHVADAAPGRITVADLGLAPEQADWIHVSGASLELSSAMSAVVMEAVERVLAHGGHLSFDPNLRGSSSGSAEHREAMVRLLQLSTVLLPADGELEAMGADTEALVRRGAVVCVTRGGEGALLLLGDEEEVIFPLPANEVDPTGAGDTFAGAFLATFLRTGNAHLAALAANRAGAAHVGALGPMERTPDWRPEE
jgi:tagatose kinase